MLVDLQVIGKVQAVVKEEVQHTLHLLVTIDGTQILIQGQGMIPSIVVDEETFDRVKLHDVLKFQEVL